MRGQSFQDLPGIPKVPIYQETLGRGRDAYTYLKLCTPIPSSLSLITVRHARAVDARANRMGERGHPTASPVN